MAWRQGVAALWLRRDQLLVTAGSVTRGARVDWRGIWSGLDFIDLDAYCSLVPWSASNEILGETLRACLRASRVNAPPPAAWANGIGSEKAEIDARLARAFGLADARKLYAGMLSPRSERILDRLVLYPTRRRRGGDFESFDGDSTPGHEDVVLSFRSGDAELGAAIRLCVERCL